MNYVNVFPNSQQELLLKACLLTGNESIDAWKKWQTNNEIHLLDYGSYRLLPLLYHNLLAQQVEVPNILELKKIYQATLVKNQLLFASAARVFKTLRDNAYNIYLLKGSALSLLCYQDLGLRPMDDIDILVDINKVFPIMKLLKNEGWEAKQLASLKQLTPGYLLVRHGHSFKKHFAMDLHWHVLSECCDPDDDIDFMQRAIPLQFQDLQLQTLNYTDHLLHIIVHGIKWDHIPAIRWIADAMYIINTAKFNIDWDLLVIPTVLFNRLEKMPIRKLQQQEFDFKISPKSQSFFMLMKQIWYQHTRKTKHANLLYRVYTFPKFLQMLWGLELVWQVPFYFISKLYERHKRMH